MAQATETAQAFADALTEKFIPYGEQFPGSKRTYAVKAGRKYDKIVETMDADRGESVFAFIERTTGNLYKPAGWKTPAPHVRYLGQDVLTKAVQDADPHGSFLYL